MSAGLTWPAIKEADRTGYLSRIESKIAEDNSIVAMALGRLDLPTNIAVSGVANEIHIGRLSPRKIEMAGSVYYLKEDAGCYAAMEKVRTTLNGTKSCIVRASEIELGRRRLVLQSKANAKPLCMPAAEILEKIVILCLFMAMFNVNDGVADNVGWIDGDICLFDLETCFQPMRMKGTDRPDRLNLLIARTGILEAPENILGIGMFRGSVAESVSSIWSHLTNAEIKWSVGRAVALALSDLDAILAAAAMLRESYIRPRVAIRPTATYGLLCNRELSLQRLFTGRRTDRDLKAALQLLPAWPKTADFALAIESEVWQIMMGGLPIFHSHPETCDLLFGNEIVTKDFFVGSAVNALNQIHTDLADRESGSFLVSLLIHKVTELRDCYSVQNSTALRCEF